MKHLPFISTILILAGCSKVVQPIISPTDWSCFQSAIPAFSSSLYDASIDIMDNRISGLLFVKVMPDSAQRVVFSSETGLTFFDFEWTNVGKFKVHFVIPKLKKKMVIKTLRNDLGLLVIPESIRKSISKEASVPIQYSALRNKEALSFKINPDCRSIARVEVIKNNKKLTDVVFYPVGKNVPDSVYIEHYTFNLKITLNRIEH